MFSLIFLVDIEKSNTFVFASEERHRGYNRKVKRLGKKRGKKAGKSCGNENRVLSLQSFPKKAREIKIHFFCQKVWWKQKANYLCSRFGREAENESKKRSENDGLKNTGKPTKLLRSS